MAVLSVGTPAGYTSIQEAVENARPFDEILVAEGTYEESVDLGRMGVAVGGSDGALTIRAEENVIVRPATGPAFYNSTPLDGDLIFENLGIQSPGGGEVPDADAAGIRLADIAGRLEVVNVVFEQIAAVGFEVERLTGDLQLLDNIFVAANTNHGPAAIRVVDMNGTAAIIGNAMADVGGSAIQWIAQNGTSAAALLEYNLIEGDAVFLSTTQTGIDVQLTGDAVLDLTLDANTLDHLSGSAIQVSLQDTAQLHSRMSLNVTENTSGEAAVDVSADEQSSLRLGLLSNSFTNSLNDGLRLALNDSAAADVVLTKNLFLDIGDSEEDEGISIASALDASATLHAFIDRNDFVTISSTGLRLSANGTSEFSAAVNGNFFAEVDTTGMSSAVLIEHGSESNDATIGLAMADNSYFDETGTVYALTQRGSGVLSLEGTAEDAATQIQSTNEGETVTIVGDVPLMTPGSLDGLIPNVLGGHVWVDADADGIQDDGESGRSRTQLQIEQGDTSITTLTDAEGEYRFVGLLPDTYSIELVPPPGFRLTLTQQGDDRALDSDFDPSTARVEVSLSPYQEQLTIDAGLSGTWRNPDNPLDVDGDGFVVPRDALIIINNLNANGSRALPIPPSPDNPPPPYLDTTGDDNVSPLDVLRIINYLNGVGEAGESESAPVIDWCPNLYGCLGLQCEIKEGAPLPIRLVRMAASDSRPI